MKFALHVGINRYDSTYYGSGNNLNMCVSDSDVMSSISAVLGVDLIYQLKDEQASAAAWLANVRELAGRADKGDIVFLSQSSHGTYQDYTSGLATKRATGMCMHDRILWDYEIREELKRFRTGVTLIWFTDCCFSQSNWRFSAGPFSTPANVKARVLKLDRQFDVKPTQGSKLQIKAHMFVYSSSNVFQPSYEDDRGGAFTTAFHGAFINSPKASYYSMMRSAQKVVAAQYPQSPVFESVRASKYTTLPFFTAIL